MNGRRFNWFDVTYALIAALLVVLALFVHFPGHVSMDSSIQLEEARLGHTITWAPRFMSALLRVLGGGSVACALFVLLNALMTYGAFVAAWDPGDGAGGQPRNALLTWSSRLLALALLLNPVVFLYMGIVWKDVLFGSMLALAAAWIIRWARHGQLGTRWWWLPVFLVHAAIYTRQHGIFLAVFFLPACAWLYATAEPARRGRRLLAFCGGYALFAVAFGMLLNLVMPVQDGKMQSVGMRNLQAYDLAGLVAEGMPTAGLPAALATTDYRAGAAKSYTPDRIDFLFNDAAVNQAYANISNQQMREVWVGSIARHPVYYANMKGEQVAWLIGLKRLDKCLPIHVGTDGNPDYLKQQGLATGLDRFDGDLIKLSMASRYLILHRHWFYIASLLAALAAVLVRRRTLTPSERVAFVAVGVGIGAFYGSFSITTIACDFRYLFPGALMSSIFVISVLSSLVLHPSAALDARTHGPGTAP